MDYGVALEAYKDKTIGVLGGKFYPLHRGHISAILKARQHVDVLFVVVQYDEQHEKELLSGSDFEHVPHKVRERWLSEEFKNYDNVRVFSHYEYRTENWADSSNLKDIYQDLKAQVGGRINKVFSSVPEYSSYFEIMLPDTEHITVFDRTNFSVDTCATDIRNKPIQDSWHLLPESVQKHYKINVSFCGIESSGKSYLSQAAAHYFNAPLVTEYGREHFDNLGGYLGIADARDYVDIAIEHSTRIKNTAPGSHRLTLIDTDLVYTQFFHYMEQGELNPVLDVMIKNDVDSIDERVFIMPHNNHVLDGTRQDITSDERNLNLEKLLELYERYGKSLHVIDEQLPEKRLSSTIDVLESFI